MVFDILNKNRTGILLFVSLVLIHLPFVQADPFISLDFSRGAFTDEGLYINQVRNFFLTGYFDIAESDGFLKAPLFNILISPFIYFNSIILLRIITTIFLSFTITFWFVKNAKGNIGLISILLLLFSQSTLFGHWHLAMSEMYCFGFLVLALSYATDSNKLHLSFLFLFMAVGCKVQYANLLILALPLGYKYIKEKHSLRKLILVFIPLGIIGVLYIYYLQEISLMLSQQTEGKIQNFGYWLFRMQVNLGYLCQDYFNVILFVMFAVSSVLAISVSNKSSKNVKISWVLLWIALAAESYKLLFIYLPQRYLVVWFGLLILITCFQINLYLSKSQRGIMDYTLLIIFLAFFILRYGQFYQKRTYQMIEAREKIDLHLHESNVLIGPWAPSLGIGGRVVSHTAWKDYFENKAYWLNNPNAIFISEKDTKDNSGLFKSYLQNESSVVLDSFSIQDWNLVLFQRTFE